MERLIPYATKRGKAQAKPDAARKSRVTRAWHPDPGFTDSELRDARPRDPERPIPARRARRRG